MTALFSREIIKRCLLTEEEVRQFKAVSIRMDWHDLTTGLTFVYYRHPDGRTLAGEILERRDTMTALNFRVKIRSAQQYVRFMPYREVWEVIDFNQHGVMVRRVDSDIEEDAETEFLKDKKWTRWLAHSIPLIKIRGCK